MLRKNKMDPTRINNYNKFLITLDKSEVIKPEVINEDPINDPVSIGKTEQLKSALEKIIDKITKNYDDSGHKSSNFNGQTTNDVLNMDMDIDDPNEYKESINVKKERNRINRMIFQRSSKKDPYIDSAVKVKSNDKPISPIKIRETINIEAEINSIDDIIQLTEKYKLDPEIKYNINMKALHNIKEPLQELNNMIGMTELKNNIVDQILYFVK